MKHQPFFISVFYGGKNFIYKSYVAPMVGDIFVDIKEFGEGHFKIVRRCLHIEEDTSHAITVNVEPMTY